MKNSILNSILVLTSFLLGYFNIENYKDIKIGLFSSTASFLISSVFVLVGCACKNYISDNDLKWMSPKFTNGFKFYKQPLQDYYVSSLLFLAYALGLFVASYVKDISTGAAILYFFTFLGGIIGVNISKTVFNKRVDAVMGDSNL